MANVSYLGVSLTLVLLLTSFSTQGQEVDIAPELYENQLKFAWGTNFKYNGLLHHNLDRVWVVTKIPLPKWSEIKLPMDNGFNISCEFPDETMFKYTDKRGSLKLQEHIQPWLRQICKASKPLMKMLQQKSLRAKEAFTTVMRDDLYAALPELSLVDRVKRWVAQVVGFGLGLATLAIEQINTHLQKSRNEAIMKTLALLRNRDAKIHNFVTQFESDFIMYGKYNVESLDKIVGSFNNLSQQTTRLETVIEGRDALWPEYYMAHAAGPSLYTHQLEIYTEVETEKHISIIERMTASMKEVMWAIAKLGEGYIPPQIFTPARLREILTAVSAMVKEKYPGYDLAIPHLTQYYDMKLVTFSVDKTDHSLIVTFPVLVKNFHKESLVLYEVETVPVPINDLNEQADSYSEVVIDKPYIAVNNEYYIQLRMQELRMCKQIHFRYYCEELFLVKHKTKHSCASALYFDLPLRIVRDNCEFKYAFNTTVNPAVLDGGQTIVLANILSKKKLICTNNFNLATPLPSYPYVLVNRSILCNCEIEAGLTYLLRSIGSCSESPLQNPMYFTINLAFYDYFREFIKSPPKHPKVARLVDWKFPVYLQDLKKVSKKTPMSLDPPTSLKELLDQMTERHHNLKDLEDDEDDSFDTEHISGPPAKVFTFVASILSCLAVLAIIAITCKYTKIKALVTGLILHQAPSGEAARIVKGTVSSMVFAGAKSETCNGVATVTVQYATPWLTYCLAGLTFISIAVYLYKNFSIRNILRGYKYDRYCTIYMYLTHNHHHVPIKLLSTTGVPHLFQVSRPFQISQVTLRTDLLWDTIHLDWDQVNITSADQCVAMPTEITIPLIDKIRVRHTLAQDDTMVHFMIRQGWLFHHITYPQLCSQCALNHGRHCNCNHCNNTLPSGLLSPLAASSPILIPPGRSDNTEATDNDGVTLNFA
jgi:hypothetical protein